MQRDLTPPFVDDGLLEIVGFTDAWHGLVLLCPNGHGTRLAQVSDETPIGTIKVQSWFWMYLLILTCVNESHE